MRRLAVCSVLLGASALPLVGLRPPPGASQSEEGPPRPSYDRPAKVRPVAGLSATLFAKEPLVRDPVAFCIDERGRIYIAESARQERGIEDNRSSPFWLFDDLQSQTVEDRLAMYEKWASKREGGMAYYRRYDDRIARIEDTNADLRADVRTEFAGPFNEPLDGTGAGIIAREGDVWYTNIPNLWRLRDTNDDGVADEREKIWRGFGIRIALRGHDMHGLTWGPDGKLYWSIGDRGYHVTLPDGRVLADPRSGAVFRCYPDGSGLEVFYTGLRNPQELAFDDYGNLFTGDNNSDGGDKARIVYLVEGGETGWRMEYQTLEGSNVRGPWNQEETWALRADLAPDKVSTNSAVQPAWTLPPLAHVGSGPSGLTFYPGLGLSDHYRDHFFLCDFLGGDSYSRVLSFALEPVGAGFKVVDVQPFIENVLPTDVDFGYDGRMYVSDWGGGWGSKDAGEIYAVWEPVAIKDPRIAEVTRLFREGFTQRPTEELARLLEHADRRVRLRAQYALAERGPALVPFLADIADNGMRRLARIHAMWALGMIAMDGTWSDAVASLVKRLDDPDAELRAQAARVIGDARYEPAKSALVRALSDSSLRVRMFAALALGKLKATDAHGAIVAMLAENDGADVFVRHAGVWALTQIGDRATTSKLMTEPQAELRLCAAIVLRRWHDASIARLLNDSDERVVVEAARAINDVPIAEAMPQLVALAPRYLPAKSAAAEAPTTEFKREVWKNVANAGSANLDDPALFAKPADETDTTRSFEGHTKHGNNYLQRVSGVIEPKESGPYVFFVASDDHSSLSLGANDDPASKTRIAWVEGYTSRGDWTSQEHQASQPVMLEAGKRYYLEVLHAQGGGDNFVAVGWQKPDGTMERPIGSGTVEPLQAPIVRRVINACVRSDDIAAAAALGDLARSDALAEAMRLEALAGLGEWMKPGPRDRVNGTWRPVDPSHRDAAAYRTLLQQKLPGLTTQGSPALRAAAREIASANGVTLDGTANLNVVVDAKQPEAERVACLRQLCVDKDARADEAIRVGLASDAPRLRAEARRQLALRDSKAGVTALRDALTASDFAERQAAIAALVDVRGDAADELLADELSLLEAGQLENGLRLDVLKAASAREGSPLAARGEAWLRSQDARGPYARFDVALDGGDPTRGFNVAHFHTSATCLKCHSIGGTGGDAAPKLDGVATRLPRAKLLESVVQPGAVIAEGFGSASAMPPMGTILTLEEIRDVVAYLSTLKTAAGK